MTKARDLANAADVLDDVSATELSYVNGVTSAIQTQLNAKQAVVSGVNDTEIGYLDGVTSAIQTQIDSKIGSASAISPTLIDAKGDLIVGSAADTAARLAVGTNNYVLTADSSATNGVKWAAPAGGGKILQVVSTTIAQGDSTTFDTSTYTDVTNLTVTITPSSASSKIFVIVSAQAHLSRGTTPRYAGARIVRSGTTIWASTNDGFIQLDSVAQSELLVVNNTIHYLDSPSSTSALTYKLQCNMAAGGGNLQISNKAPSTITVWEIGA